MNNYNNIPEELRLLNQWLVWQYVDIGAAKPTKIPYNARTGKLAATDDPISWCTFEEAVAASHNYSGIGFVFTKNDPYTFIDLDATNGDTAAYDRHKTIFEEFNSYSEVSPSGFGLHIIIKGHIPKGRRRSFVEIYSDGRYATMTGNVYRNNPITNHQHALDMLWEQMGSGSPATLSYHGNEQENAKDVDVIATALNAVNGDKFKILHEGNWQEIYQSQSEADLAYINIIAFYTQNSGQIERIFRSSKLGQRPKAARKDYVRWMIEKSFDNMLPPLDIDGFKIALENKILQREAQQLELKIGPVAQAGTIYNHNHNAGVSFNGRTVPFEGVNLGSNPSTPSKEPQMPPGLLGELAQFIYNAAPRPVPEVALAGAIGLLAGIAGRAYNISGTGLNQYVLLIAQTGVGKESLASGIDRVMNAVQVQVPTAVDFVGPSEIASGQALVKYISKTSQCFVSVLGEFGLRLQSMSSQTANSSEVSLRRMLLDLYNKSGHGQTFRASIYADSEKNTKVTEAPSFSILGESTPERFYGALSEDMISEGLLPRFMLIEYNGIRPPYNKLHQEAKPTFQLIDKIAALTANASTLMHARKVINISMSEQAQTLADAFDKHADKEINNTRKEVLRQLWNRAHMKVLKLSGLIAVGVNMSDPCIQAEHVLYSIKMIEEDIMALSTKFEAGEIGNNSSETKQSKEVIRCVRDYIQEDWEHAKKYLDIKQKYLYDAKVIPYMYILRRLGATLSFKGDKMGATNSIKRTIQNLIDGDVLREIGKAELSKKYGTTQKCYVVSNTMILD